ncbi:unnamed protein product [Triticum aestivum]|uniref:GRF-type domain-containing protein n=1 Tax=Triticum aestivum TaxID=4565 RepID=A0A7H4LC61_WHEAT|nr:unnamed protein product [Triticum aestivum]
MVFEDESSEETSSLPYMHSTSSTDRLNQVRQVPFSVEDPDYQGLELETMSPCEKHGKASERLVAFEGTDTGRRFLACAEPPLRYRALPFLTLRNLACIFQQWASSSALGLREQAQMAKRDAESEKLKQNYEVLLNLTRAQATIIQNLKLKHITDKQLLSEAKMNLELKNAELTKSEEKLTQDKLELKFQVADLLKGKEKHGEEMVQLELQFAELMKAEEKLKEKIKGIQAILEK